MDAYNSQDITNPKFTSYIARPQMEMYKWMRAHLDPGVRIQDYFEAKSNFIESYVSETPPFANRTQYVGTQSWRRFSRPPKRSWRSEDCSRMNWRARKIQKSFHTLLTKRESSTFLFFHHETTRSSSGNRTSFFNSQWRSKSGNCTACGNTRCRSTLLEGTTSHMMWKLPA